MSHLSLADRIKNRLIGQHHAVDIIAPYVDAFQANLHPSGRPVGVFLLLGPTGVGKTHTAEVFAEALHGSQKHFLRIDCGEYQMDHEVAKLIGAPPGYLGHRDTPALLSQKAVSENTSNQSKLSIVLFDEIEKAAPSLMQILLGVLDRAFLRTGDNNPVDFENSLILLSSNLGAKEASAQLSQRFGFPSGVPNADQLHGSTMKAVRRHFSPEFVNRIDACITYRPLTRENLEAILERQLVQLQTHLEVRLGLSSFDLEFTDACRERILSMADSDTCGAREIKRLVQRLILQPLSRLIVDRKVRAASIMEVDCVDGEMAFNHKKQIVKGTMA